MSQHYNSETLSEYIEDFMNDDVNKTTLLQSKMGDEKSIMANDESNMLNTRNEKSNTAENGDETMIAATNMVDEDIVHLEEIHVVEATPFFPDASPVVLPGSETLLSGDNFRNAVERQLSESGKITSIDYEVDGNKMMIQDLKTSVISLKVATSRIEREVKEIADAVSKCYTEKKALDNSLVDLEFRFNELVTNDDDDDEDNEENESGHGTSVSSTVSTSTTTSTSQSFGGESNRATQSMEFQNQFIKSIIQKLEGKVYQMDEKISDIDQQHDRVKIISEDIARHEQIVQDIKALLHQQSIELLKVTRETVAKKDTTTIPKTSALAIAEQQHNQECKETCGPSPSIQSTVTEFIAKTEMNERSIATAWVGLVGALLLIPIAWILGKFF